MRQIIQRLKRTIPVWAKNRLKQYLLKSRLAHFNAYEVERNIGETRMKIYVADSLAQGWYDGDMKSLREIELLQEGKLKPGATIFNLGAHQGVVGLMLSNAVGQRGKVVCVEGTLHNVNVGLKNIELNGVKNIEFIHSVVGECETGKIPFNATLDGQVNFESGASLIDSICIDRMTERFGVPTCLYIDVEGFECQVLRGAMKTLDYFPDCFIEVHVNFGLEKFGTVDEILQCFSSRGYRLLTATNELDFETVGEPP